MFREAQAIGDHEALRYAAHAPCAVPDAVDPRTMAFRAIPTRRLRGSRWLQVWDAPQAEWNLARAVIDDLPAGLAGLRIAHLTDLHVRNRWERGHDDLVAQLRARRPDLIVVTGDLVEDKHDHRSALPTLRRLLGALEAPLGVFGVTGNHDGPLLAGHVRGMNVELLDGRRALVRTDRGDVELVGLPGPFRVNLTQEFLDAVPPRRAGVPRIVLSHYPDHLLKVVGLEPDVLLAGHTHGGQCCLPGGIPIMWHDRLPRPLCSGVYRVGRTCLCVSRGLGLTGVSLRAFCPTEVIELELGNAEG